MASIIIHKDGAYNFYSTIVDAPNYESALTLEQVKEITKEEYGNSGLEILSERLERAHAKGTSSWLDSSMEDTISCNHAGPNETRMSTEHFIAKYLTLNTRKKK